MKVLVDSSFEKDVLKIKDQAVKSKIAAMIRQVLAAGSVAGIKNIKKLQGTTGY